ncbi:MAG: DUF4139 domain-containing protein [Victivallales bacterium]|jgi:hypothetical protein|nr:DUF4139 domain-containing protein [Victivallales bacterium]
MKFWSKLLCAASVASFTLTGADEPTAKAPITHAALFQNNYALLVREVQSSPADKFLLEESIAPVYGSLWFFPGDNLSVTGVKKTSLTPTLDPLSNLANSYENLEVTVTLRTSGNEAARIVSGTMVRLGENNSNNFLAIRQKDGKLTVFRNSEVVTIESSGVNNTETKVENRLWMIERKNLSKNPLQINYLASGLSWEPALRVALGQNSILQIDRAATVVNQLEDLKDVEISLVSGFPDFQYLGRISALTSGKIPGLSVRMRGEASYRYDVLGELKHSEVKMNQSMISPLASSGTTEDICYTSFGKISLAKGEAFYKTLDSGTAKYERIVDWEIPDYRDVWGRLKYNFDDVNVNRNGDLWDAVRFKNPFTTPIASTPVEIVDGEKLLGQTTFKWVNPGEEALLKIAKAPTVSGIRTEFENSDKRELIRWGSYNYRRPVINGSIKIRNFRKSEVKVVAKLQFSGELTSVQGDPQSRVLNTGAYSVNPRRELIWEITVKPGEEVIHAYQYTLLVRESH